MMKLGIGSYTFAWAVGVPGRMPERPMSACDLVEEASRLGVGLVQVCDNLPFLDLSEDKVDGFEGEVQRRGIAVEWGTRGLDPDVLRRNLALCRRFGCSVLRLVIDSAGDEPSADEAVERLAMVLPEFEQSGVVIAVENHDRFRVSTLAQMVEELGPTRVGITLDTVNSFGALETPQTVVEVLGPYTRCLHIKDFTVQRVWHQLGFTVEGCAAGDGQLDVPWLLRELDVRCRHDFNVVLETWVTPTEALDETIERERRWADEGVAYLRTLIPD